MKYVKYIFLFIISLCVYNTGFSFDITSTTNTGRIVTSTKPIVSGSQEIQTIIEKKFKGLTSYYRKLAFKNGLQQKTTLRYEIQNNSENLLSILIASHTRTTTGNSYDYHTINIENNTRERKVITLSDLQKKYIELLGKNRYYQQTGYDLYYPIYNYLTDNQKDTSHLYMYGYDEQRLFSYITRPKITLSTSGETNLLTIHIASGVLGDGLEDFHIPISLDTYQTINNASLFDNKLKASSRIVLDPQEKETCSSLHFQESAYYPENSPGVYKQSLWFVSFSGDYTMFTDNIQEEKNTVKIKFFSGQQIGWGFYCDTFPADGGFCKTLEYIGRNNRILSGDASYCKNSRYPKDFIYASGVTIELSKDNQYMKLTSLKNQQHILLEKSYPNERITQQYYNFSSQ